eukprot:gnl/Dysnectes_brevis/4256_a5640_693.p1 GENE.gnl/Dysnectes_brevis/4256_a5640_693~~gnl/Dysnectes_brevis/4256_a5640_693.p1  ORF type:complete len:1201 (-),score=315.35 gnl/Dysnectes_brevis/4256_a5640_693:81-3629(-)
MSEEDHGDEMMFDLEDLEDHRHSLSDFIGNESLKPEGMSFEEARAAMFHRAGVRASLSSLFSNSACETLPFTTWVSESDNHLLPFSWNSLSLHESTPPALKEAASKALAYLRTAQERIEQEEDLEIPVSERTLMQNEKAFWQHAHHTMDSVESCSVGELLQHFIGGVHQHTSGLDHTHSRDAAVNMTKRFARTLLGLVPVEDDSADLVDIIPELLDDDELPVIGRRLRFGRDCCVKTVPCIQQMLLQIKDIFGAESSLTGIFELVSELLAHSAVQERPSNRTVVFELVSAADVPPTDIDLKSDPFVKVEVHEKGEPLRKLRTHIVHNSLNPCWHQSFVLHGHVERIKMRLFDYDEHSGNDKIGKCEVDLPTSVSAISDSDDQWTTNDFAAIPAMPHPSDVMGTSHKYGDQCAYLECSLPLKKDGFSFVRRDPSKTKLRVRVAIYEGEDTTTQLPPMLESEMAQICEPADQKAAIFAAAHLLALVTDTSAKLGPSELICHAHMGMASTNYADSFLVSIPTIPSSACREIIARPNTCRMFPQSILTALPALLPAIVTLMCGLIPPVEPGIWEQVIRRLSALPGSPSRTQALCMVAALLESAFAAFDGAGSHREQREPHPLGAFGPVITAITNVTGWEYDSARIRDRLRSRVILLLRQGGSIPPEGEEVLERVSEALESTKDLSPLFALFDDQQTLGSFTVASLQDTLAAMCATHEQSGKPSAPPTPVSEGICFQTWERIAGIQDLLERELDTQLVLPLGAITKVLISPITASFATRILQGGNLAANRDELSTRAHSGLCGDVASVSEQSTELYLRVVRPYLLSARLQGQEQMVLANSHLMMGGSMLVPVAACRVLLLHARYAAINHRSPVIPDSFEGPDGLARTVYRHLGVSMGLVNPAYAVRGSEAFQLGKKIAKNWGQLDDNEMITQLTMLLNDLTLVFKGPFMDQTGTWRRSELFEPWSATRDAVIGPLNEEIRSSADQITAMLTRVLVRIAGVDLFKGLAFELNDDAGKVVPGRYGSVRAGVTDFRPFRVHTTLLHSIVPTDERTKKERVLAELFQRVTGGEQTSMDVELVGAGLVYLIRQWNAVRNKIETSSRRRFDLSMNRALDECIHAAACCRFGVEGHEVDLIEPVWSDVLEEAAEEYGDFCMCLQDVPTRFREAIAAWDSNDKKHPYMKAIKFHK